MASLIIFNNPQYREGILYKRSSFVNAHIGRLKILLSNCNLVVRKVKGYQLDIIICTNRMMKL